MKLLGIEYRYKPLSVNMPFLYSSSFFLGYGFNISFCNIGINMSVYLPFLHSTSFFLSYGYNISFCNISLKFKYLWV